MKAKKIAFVVTDFPTVSETFIVNQINSLINRGYEIDIICLGLFIKEGIQHNIIKKHNLMNKVLCTPQLPKNKLIRVFIAIKLLVVYFRYMHIIILAFNPLKYGRQAFDFQQFYKMCAGLKLIKNNYNAIHIHFGQNAVSLMPILNKIKKQVSLLVSFHGFDAHDYTSKFYAELTQSGIKVTANTEYTATQLLKLGFNSSLIEILPESLDTSLFVPTTVRGNSDITNIIFVGRLVKWKAPDLVIEIIKRIVQLDHKVKCTIIGMGDLWEECNNLIKTYDLENTVDMLGQCSQESIKSLMTDSDIFLYPGIVGPDGRCENQGLVIQEAQAMELPVLVSDVGGMKDGLIDGSTGYLIQANDLDTFVKKIEYLIQNPIEKRVMGKKGCEYIKSNYDSAILADRLVKVYGFEK